MLRSPRFATLSSTSSGAVVLCYHHVGETHTEFTDNLGITISRRELEEDLFFLRKYFEVVPLHELAATPQSKKLVAVTFDDGYRSVLREALPLFQEFQMPFSIFLNYGALVSGVPWLNQLNRLLRSLSAFQLATLYREALGEKPASGSERGVNAYIHKFRFPETPRTIDAHYAQHFKDAPPSDLFMTEDDIRTLRDHPLITWGSHSYNHYPLHRLPAEIITEELVGCHAGLKTLLGQRLEGCAPPFGNRALLRNETVVRVISSFNPYFISCTGEANPGEQVGRMLEIRRFPSARGMAHLRRVVGRDR